MPKNHALRGIRYEKVKARAHRGIHVGGPGKHDYQRGDVKGEVKCQKTPITQPVLMQICQKGIREVDSKSGFTQPAIDYRDRYCPGMKLMKRSRTIR